MDDYFIDYFNLIVPPIILITGLIGNTMGFKIALNLKRNTIRSTSNSKYKYLFASDCLFLIQIVFVYLKHAFNYDVSVKSNVLCKIVQYFKYSLATISPMIIVYIAIERVLFINCFNKFNLITKKVCLLIYLSLVVLFNFILYLPIPLNFNVKTSLDNKTECNFLEVNSRLILISLDLVNRVLIPFILMISCSFLLIYFIFKSRTKVSDSNMNFKSFRKETKLSLTLITVNLIHLALNFPYSIEMILNNTHLNITYFITLYLFYSSYAINFFLILTTNSMFRKEFFNICKSISIRTKTGHLHHINFVRY